MRITRKMIRERRKNINPLNELLIIINQYFPVNDTIRMYKKGKIRMYKIVHKINPKVHSFVIL